MVHLPRSWYRIEKILVSVANLFLESLVSIFLEFLPPRDSYEASGNEIPIVFGCSFVAIDYIQHIDLKLNFSRKKVATVGKVGTRALLYMGLVVRGNSL